MLIGLFAERRALLTSKVSPSVFVYFQGRRTKAAAEVADVAFEEQIEAFRIERSPLANQYVGNSVSSVAG